MKRMRKIVSILITGILMLSLCGCDNPFAEDEPEATPDPYAITVYTVDTLEDDTYYIHHRDEFYKIGQYAPSFLDDSDEGHVYKLPINWDGTPTPEGDKQRSFFYEKDKSELLIPTMYADDEIVYKTSAPMEGDIEWERFADGGYTFPVRGLSLNGYNKVIFENWYFNIPKDSALVESIPRASSSDQEDENGDRVLNLYTLNSIDSTPLTAEMITDYGTIKDPALYFDKGYDAEYTLDFYLGTNLIRTSLSPNWRIFYNFENYWTDAIEHSDNGYIVLKIGTSFKTGYYKVNSSGMFRYVAKPYADGLDIASLKYNIAYFPYKKDEDGEEKIQFNYDEQLRRFVYENDEDLTRRDEVDPTKVDEGITGNDFTYATPTVQETPTPSGVEIQGVPTTPPDENTEG